MKRHLTNIIAGTIVLVLAWVALATIGLAAHLVWRAVSYGWHIVP